MASRNHKVTRLNQKSYAPHSPPSPSFSIFLGFPSLFRRSPFHLAPVSIDRPVEEHRRLETRWQGVRRRDERIYFSRAKFMYDSESAMDATPRWDPRSSLVRGETGRHYRFKTKTDARRCESPSKFHETTSGKTGSRSDNRPTDADVMAEITAAPGILRGIEVLHATGEDSLFRQGCGKLLNITEAGE